MPERASEDIVIDAAPGEIMAVITDFESYPEWVRNMKDVEVRATDEHGRGQRVWYHVDARVMDVHYVLSYTYHDDTRLTWELVEGDQINTLDGEYLLDEQGEATRVRYTLEVDVAFPLPGFMKKRAAAVIMETGLGELKRRVEGG